MNFFNGYQRVGHNPPATMPPPPLPGKKSIDNVEMNTEVMLINRIIYQAIEHGGDAGGAYCSCGDSLRLAVQNWLKYKEYHKYYRVSQAKDCQIVPIVALELHNSDDFEF